MTLNLGTSYHFAGVFSRSQALDSGETDRTLAAAVRDGLLVRLGRACTLTPAYTPRASDAGRHLLSAPAALAAQKGRVR